MNPSPLIPAVSASLVPAASAHERGTPREGAELPPATRAEGLLRGLDNSWHFLDRFLQRFIPRELNPFNQLGAAANTCLLIAVLSGIVLLCWYTPSVHQAHASLEKIRTSSWLGQLTRSVHRYSSDGCMFFVLLHAARIVCQRRFTGPRWLAWTSGVLLLALLGFIGWTGYWLVWDVRAQNAALGTARLLDRVPIFTEPLSRAFLTDQSVPSLFFFLIFFVHMLTPLAMGIGVWVHLMRVNRARFLASWEMTLWICASLIVLGLVAPAESAQPAQMTAKAAGFTIDGWFLWPLQLTDRLSGGALWALLFLGGITALSAPWWMLKRKLTPAWKAEVDLPRCIGCSLCSKDCPFNAITMVPREDGRKFEVQSHVNPALCVGCGICTGACDSQAINLPALNSRQVEKRLTAWIQDRTARGEPAYVAFCCGESAGSSLAIDAEGNSAKLPGYRVERVPCIGWVSAVLLERLLQRGAAGILVAGCSEGEPVAREGINWFKQRMTGEREPSFNPAKADRSRIRHARFNRTERNALVQAAADFLKERSPAPEQPAGRWQKLALGVVLAGTLGAVILGFSNLPYRTGRSPEPELVVSFNHGGAILEARKLSKAQLEKRLPHMRAQINVSRERSPVRLRIILDGKTALDRAFAARGLSKDGPSIALVRLPVSAGVHQVQVDMADAHPEEWTKHWSQSVAFETNRIRVILFDTKDGFSLH